MSQEKERALISEVGELHATITDIDRVLKGDAEQFGPAPNLALEDLGEIIESRAFFVSRREAVVAQLGGESLLAVQRAA